MTSTDQTAPDVDTSDLLEPGTPLLSVGAVDKAKLKTCTVTINGTDFRFVEPDAGTMMDIEEAQQTRRILQLLAGRFWSSDMRDAIDSLSREDAIRVADEIGGEFELDDSVMATVQQPRNRRERRARRRGGRK